MNYKHGQAIKGKISPEYKSWGVMIQRCENPKNTNFRYYGRRGINVCERWHSFEHFLEDMGPRPKGKSLDRYPDNNGNYELSNCRWATREEQQINSRPISCGPCKQYWFRAWHKDSMAQWMSNNQQKFAREWELNQGNISAYLRGKQETYRGWSFERIKS